MNDVLDVEQARTSVPPSLADPPDVASLGPPPKMEPDPPGADPIPCDGHAHVALMTPLVSQMRM